MGIRYRKSINLGGGFRINISKSGIGYSWGVKGYRVTKTAKGTTRTTASIPGTGFSYVHESQKPNDQSSQHSANPTQQSVPVIDDNHYDTQDIVNNNASEMVSEGLESMLASATRAIKLKTTAAVGFWITLVFGVAYHYLFILTALFTAMYFFVKKKGMIDLEYEIESDQQSLIDSRMNPYIKIAECSKVWRIMQTSIVINQKYHAGACHSVNRIACTSSFETPFPFRTNIKAAVIKAKRETLLFLPDKLLIIQGSKIGALNYNDISSHTYADRFIESETVPNDTRLVGHTWQYVNKSGGPDKRFKNNKELPICLYGKLELKSSSGLNTVIMFSNPDAR